MPPTYNDPRLTNPKAQAWKQEVVRLATEQFDNPGIFNEERAWLMGMYHAGYSPARTVLIYETTAAYRMYDFLDPDVTWRSSCHTWDFTDLHAARRQ